jgi:hypothetical protein
MREAIPSADSSPFFLLKQPFCGAVAHKNGHTKWENLNSSGISCLNCGIWMYIWILV